MNNNLTEVVFIIDRSGSMEGLEKDTIGGFNSMLTKQKQEDGDAYVTTILFNHESRTIHDRIPIEEVEPLTLKDYEAWGSTALVDAIGDAVNHISKIHRYARREDVPENTVFIITTDGMENDSHKYSSDEVKKLIKKKQEKNGWTFLFLGANIDSVEVAGNIGIHRDNAVNYVCDSRGTDINYKALSSAVSDIRKSKKLSKAWKEEIMSDYETRS